MASDKKKKPTSKVVATAVSVAAGVVFSAGAVSLAQGSTQFDPGNFVSAYAHGDDGSDKGYRASRSDVDAQANRHSNESEDDSRSTSNQMLEDAFSQMPFAGDSGTTAYRVSSDAPQDNRVGTGTAGGGSNAANGGDGNVVVGPVVPGNGNAGDANNGNGNGNGAGDDPSEPSTPDNPGTPDTPDNPSQPETPWVNPLPNDPTPSKEGYSLADEIVSDSSSSTVAANATNTKVHIGQIEDSFYAGQPLDPWRIFCSLTTVFGYKGSVFQWYCSTPEEFASYNYFKVKSYPKTVPDSDTFEIEVSYRFSPSSEWVDEKITCSVSKSSLFVVGLSPDNYGDGQSYVRKLLSDGETCLLYPYTERALEAAGAINDWGYQTKLLMNWDVDGKNVGFSYESAPGRHVATPGEFVDVPAGCRIAPERFYDESYQLRWYQTLKGVDGDSRCFVTSDDGETSLVVPDGVNSISIFDDYGYTFTDKLVVPSSVLNINLSDSMTLTDTTLLVAEGYEVSGDNPIYASTSDGILTNKSGTEYLAIPFFKEELVVPEGVTKVDLSRSVSNYLKKVVLEAGDAQSLPELDASRLNDDCVVVVDDGVFQEYVEANKTALSGSDLGVAKAGNQADVYRVDHGMLHSSEEVARVVDGESTMKLDVASKIASGAFDGCKNVESVVLSDDVANYSFSENCFANSGIKRIICSTAEQEQEIKQNLDYMGVPDAEVLLTETSAEGVKYATSSKGGEEKSILLEAPKDIVSFDGALKDSRGNDVEIDEIAPGAFEGCKKLETIEASAKTKAIGSRAFTGCTSLQTVFSNSRDSISLGEDALAGCTSLRFVVLQAMSGDIMSGNSIDAVCGKWVPTGSSYSDYAGDSNFLSFTKESGICDYQLIALADGGTVLYGTDAQGSPWIAIGSSADVSGKVRLPETTIEMYSDSFAGIKNDFAVDWSNLTSLEWIDESVFEGSNIAGEISLDFGSKNITIGQSAFKGCSKIESFHVKASAVGIGTDAFKNCSSLGNVRIESDALDLGDGAFGYCDNLHQVEINAGKDESANLHRSLKPAAFAGCDASSLTLKFTNENPIGWLLEFEGGISVSFTLEASSDEGLKLDIPEEYRNKYLEEWVCPFAGYDSLATMEDAIYSKMKSKNGVAPSTTELLKETSSQLLVAENRLRKMMGMPEVESSTILRFDGDDTYSISSYGDEAMLLSVSTDAETIDLDELIPEKYSSFSIAKDCFSSCKNLKNIILSDRVTGIQSGALNGLNEVKITVPDTATAPFALLGSSRISPFSFGCASVSLAVPESLRDEFVESWVFPLLGYDDFDDMYSSVSQDLRIARSDGTVPTDAEILDEMHAQLLSTENKIRGLMGVDAAQDSVILQKEMKDGNEFYIRDGQATLVRAAANSEVIDLESSIPNDCLKLKISGGAFSACSGLKKIILPTFSLTELANNAFASCDGVEVVVGDYIFAPQLSGGSEYSPYSFGAAVKLNVSEEKRQEILQSWTWEIYGIGTGINTVDMDLRGRGESHKWRLEHYGYQVTGESLNESVNSDFLKQENILRGYMGLNQIADYWKAVSFYDAAANFGLTDKNLLEQTGDKSEDRAVQVDAVDTSTEVDKGSVSKDDDAALEGKDARPDEGGVSVDAGKAGAASDEGTATKPASSDTAADAKKSEAAPTDSASDGAALDVESEN